jgi:hypothetical protein
MEQLPAFQRAFVDALNGRSAELYQAAGRVEETLEIFEVPAWFAYYDVRSQEQARKAGQHVAEMVFVK